MANDQKKRKKKRRQQKISQRPYKWIQMFIEPGAYLDEQKSYVVNIQRDWYLAHRGPWGTTFNGQHTIAKPHASCKKFESQAQFWPNSDPKRPDHVNFWIRLVLTSEQLDLLSGKQPPYVKELEKSQLAQCVPKSLVQLTKEYLVEDHLFVKFWIFENHKYASHWRKWGFNEREIIVKVFSHQSLAEEEQWACYGYTEKRHVGMIGLKLGPHLLSSQSKKHPKKRQKTAAASLGC
jgi:hypothetical protein